MILLKRIMNRRRKSDVCSERKRDLKSERFCAYNIWTKYPRLSFHQSGKAKLFLVKVRSENVDKIFVASLGNTILLHPCTRDESKAWQLTFEIIFSDI